MCWKNWGGGGNKNTQSENPEPVQYEELLTSSILKKKAIAVLHLLSLTGRRPRKFHEISHGHLLSKPYLQVEITFPSQSKL
jgi:hypothetical protein